MKRTSRVADLWVLTVPSFRNPKKRNFLYETSGDWGPCHLTTDDVLEAMTFSSKAQALNSDAAHGWSDVEAVAIQVRTIVKFVNS